MTQGKVKLLLVVFVLVLSSPLAFPTHAHAAIALDAASSTECDGGVNNCSGSSQMTYSITVGSGANRLLVVATDEDTQSCASNNGFGAASTTAITYDSVPLTEIASHYTSDGCTGPSHATYADLWYLVNPPSGNNPIVITFSNTVGSTGSLAALSAAASFTGVNQSTPIRASNATDDGGTTALSAAGSVSSVAGDLVFDSVCGGGSADSSNQSTLTIFNYNTGSSCNNIGASARIATTSSTAMSWNVNSADGGDFWTEFATSIEPAGVPLTTQIFLTSGSSWTVPSDWNNSNNTIECIGGGGAGGGNNSFQNGGGGGGGGEYREALNTTYTPGSVITIQVGAGGSGSSGDGGSGTASFIENNSNSGDVCLANGGGGGTAPPSNPSAGGTGGTGGTGGAGAVGFNGGSAADVDGVGGSAGSPGGGAGGPHGSGGAGVFIAAAGATGGGANGGGAAGIDVFSTANGQAGGNSLFAVGGAGGVVPGAGTAGTDGSGGGGGGGGADPTNGNGGDGGAGIDWDSSHGSGGGGGGGGGTGGDFSGVGANGGGGGLYGGGGGGSGGGASGGASTGGNGKQGIIVISYTPTGGATGRVIRLIGHVRLIGGVRLAGTSPIPTNGGGGGGCSQATAFLGRVSVDSTHQTAYTNLICGLVSDGVWSKLDLLYIFATQNSTAALDNLVNTSFTATAEGGPTFTADSGYTTASGAYVTSNFNFSTNGTNYTQNSASIGGWSGTAGSSFSYSWLTNTTFGGNTNILNFNPSDGTTGFSINGSSALSEPNAGDASGMFALVRPDSATEIMYRNGASLGSISRASVALENGVFETAGDNGTPGNNGAFLIRAMFAGGGLTSTDVSNFYSLMHTYMTVVGVVTYVGPGDIVSGASAWWGLRAYDAASVETKDANICRASDSTCEDIYTLSNGKFDAATAASFCASTTCTVKTLYDQTGNGHDMTQTTTAEQPVLIFNCIGSLPCMTFNSADSQQLQTAQFITSEPFTISAIADRTTAGAVGVILGDNASVIAIWADTPSNEWTMSSSNNVDFAASDNAFHAVEGVFNTSSSNAYLDSTSNPMDLGSDFPIGNGGLGFGGADNFNFEGDINEAGLWASAFDAVQADTLNNNQHSYWGF